MAKDKKESAWTKQYSTWWLIPIIFGSCVYALSLPSQEEEAKKRASLVIKTDQPIILGDVQYTVHGFRFRNRIGRGMVAEKPASGAVFVVVDYSVKNVSNSSFTLWGNDMTLMDGKGRRYKESSKASLTLAAEQKQQWLTMQLDPGIEERVKKVFQMPKPVAQLSMELSGRGLLADTARGAWSLE